MQGRVVDTITGDQAEQDIDSLASKYIGQDVYPFRARSLGALVTDAATIGGRRLRHMLRSGR